MKKTKNKKHNSGEGNKDKLVLFHYNCRTYLTKKTNLHKKYIKNQNVSPSEY